MTDEVERHFSALLGKLRGEPRSVRYVEVKKCRRTLTNRKNKSVTPADLFPVIEIILRIPSVSGSNENEKNIFTQFKKKIMRQAADQKSELFLLLQRLGFYQLTIEIREWHKGQDKSARTEFQLRQSLKKRSRTKAA